MLKRALCLLLSVVCITVSVSLTSCGDTSSKEESGIKTTTTTITEDDENEYEDEDYEFDDGEDDDYDYDEYLDDDFEDDTDFEEEYTPTSYYDKLVEEYDSKPNFVRLYEYYQHEIDGKIYRYDVVKSDEYVQEEGNYYTQDSDYYLCIYDLNNNAFSKEKIFTSKNDFLYSSADVVFFNNIIYVIMCDYKSESEYKLSLKKFDLSCKELASYDLLGISCKQKITSSNKRIEYISENGDVIFYDGDDYTIIDSSFKNAYEIPYYTVEAKHGVTEDRKAYPIAIYDNNVYSRVKINNDDDDWAYVKYDISSKKWSDVLYSSYYDMSGQIIGKYAFSRSDDDFTIINIEDGSILATIRYSFARYNEVHYGNGSGRDDVTSIAAALFKYGKSHIIIDDVWHEIRIHGDGSTTYQNYNVDMGYDGDKGNKHIVDAEHYVFTDSYGIFLRTFRNGENDEVDVERYDN